MRTAPGTRPAAPVVKAAPATTAATPAPAGTSGSGAKADAPTGAPAATPAPAVPGAAAPASASATPPADGGATPPAAAPTAPDADEAAKRFAALSRRDAATRQAEAKAKIREGELSVREKALEAREAKAVGAEGLAKLANDDPHGFMEKIGVNAKTFLMALGRAPAADDPIAKVNKSLAEERTKREALEKKLEDDRKAAEEGAKKTSAEQAARNVEAAKAKVAGELAAKPEAFERLLAHDENGEKGHDLVWSLMQAQWAKATKEHAAALAAGEPAEKLQTLLASRIMPIEEAAARAEEYLEERDSKLLERLGRFKKQPGITPPAPAAAAPAASGKPPKPTGIGRSPTLSSAEPAASTPAGATNEQPRFKTKRELDAWTEAKRKEILGRSK